MDSLLPVAAGLVARPTSSPSVVRTNLSNSPRPLVALKRLGGVGNQFSFQHRKSNWGTKVEAFAEATRVSENLSEIRFRVPVRVNFGERVLIVGSDPALGGWAVEKAVVMEWTEGDMWKATVDIAPGVHEFKCVVLRESGVTWEPGPNRTISIPHPGDMDVKCEMWDTNTTFVEQQSSGFILEDKYYSTSAPDIPVPENDNAFPPEHQKPEGEQDNRTVAADTILNDDQEMTLGSQAEGSMVENWDQEIPMESNQVDEYEIPTEQGTVGPWEQEAIEKVLDEDMPAAFVDQYTLEEGETATLGEPLPEAPIDQLGHVEVDVEADSKHHDALSHSSARPEIQQLQMVAGGHIVPHVDKAEKGGEDAFFISTAGLGAIGVADGVSSWASDGVDPALYPQALLKSGQEAFEEKEGQIGALEIMAYGQYGAKLLGSSTACIAVMKEGNVFEVANLGDSGFRLLREGQIIAASEVQEHEFNFPFQLSHPGYVSGGEFAKDSDIYRLEVMPGDMLILATDGLFDNMWDEDLCDLVGGVMLGLAPCKLAAQAVAAAITMAAHENAQDEQFFSPWTAGVTGIIKKRGGTSKIFAGDQSDNPYLGGKMDDCTVVVAFVM